ncbi:mitochondrial fission ELM1 family protein [Asticcacaulis benevestitus]|uniref:Nucleoside-diphosphate sugar epimerase n=1 Tax=Asticcacaulis benevestitus DSM 16100 = ATCC BAA-896 TaxID=1121022 RepID=V4PU26_9CAUL|nr:mitochondrial fission ELM1 family protein [Asticcacaulis benevestitus]ESQ90889.1 hypothetical protein ABENE_11510 [Asticcacaulis benevestitus DSM 16100 = ATCC BAA-896]
MPQPLTIWAVSDGRVGIENQALGLAEAVQELTASTIVVKRIRYSSLYDRLPTALKLWPDAMLSERSDSLDAPYPDIWIAAGRATVPFSSRMRKRSGQRTMVVQLQNPRHNLKAFDLVIAPEHDHVRGKNVLSLIGSTNRVAPHRLEIAYENWRDHIDNLPHPRVCVMVGGRSKAYDIDEKRAHALAIEIRSAIQQSGGSLLLTVSRRTPDNARRVFEDVLHDLPGIIYDGKGENPYFAFLYAADHFLVTEDSVNMATEVAGTGKPLQILPLERRTLGSGEKFEDFHETLRAKGIAHPFNGILADGHYNSAHTAYPPLNETKRAAEHLLTMYLARRP